MIDIKQNTFLREIPDNLLKDKKVVNFANSLQKSLDSMNEWVDKINYTSNIENLPDEIIEHLLWEKHITWNEGLSLASTRQEKIRLIESAIELHRTKGTAGAIELVMDILNFNGEVSEWFEYGGDPYLFRVLTESSMFGVNIDQLVAMINEFKNVRSWLESITVNRKLNFNLNFGGVLSEYQITTISPEPFNIPNFTQSLSFGGVVTKYNKTQIEMPLFQMPNFEFSRYTGGAFSSWKQTTIYPKEVA